MNEKTFLDYLIENNLIEPNQLDLVKKEAMARNLSEDEVIIDKKLISEKEFYKLKSNFLKIPLKIFEDGSLIAEDALREIPEEVARYYQFIPFEKNGRFLKIGMVNPQDLKANDALKFLTLRSGSKMEIFLISKSDFNSVIGQYETVKKLVSKALEELEEELKEEDIIEKKSENITIEAPITKMVSVILRHAVEGRASDIHIEPIEERVRVRYRVDGILYTTLFIPKDIHAAIVSRIKILANLKIDETRIPQDGRFRVSLAGRHIDFRVSTLPTSTGEKVAMRVLDPEIKIMTFNDLGLSGRTLEILEREIKKPFGMILLTGPTGSGKTTTLYGILNVLNKEGSNIITLEDPVEYYIEGVNQSQIRPEIGYTFSAGLRHIVRQDPNIIMVGEIRDNETAELAVHASLTGHLVLSTLHTNNAISVISRLVDMKVEPFLLPSTLNIALAQRLVRKLCPDCKKSVEVSESMEKAIDEALKDLEDKSKVKKPYTIYEPNGCPKCLQSGFRGRIGLFEAFEMTSQIDAIVSEGITETKLKAEAKRQKMITMQQDGILKALDGMVSLKEILEATIGEE